MKPQNLEEQLVWWSLIGTWPAYFIGGLYILGPVLGWVLAALVVRRWWQQTPEMPPEERLCIPTAVWVWIGSMLVMELALILGHLDFNLDTGLLIKSSIGWMKGWALLAVFPLAGCLNIRPELVSRGLAIASLHTLLILPFFILAGLAHLPETPYVSPLKVVGGPGPEFFALSLYEIEPDTNALRWRLFTPWAPALGAVANFWFVGALDEPDRNWKLITVTACIGMVVISKSRLAFIALPVTLGLFYLVRHLTRPMVLFLAGLVATLAGMLSSVIIEAYQDFYAGFRSMRAASSRVRETLGRIAVHRWRTEAPIWGHGVVETGPHIVEYMPIGSHHTWFGLLFVKGIVGVAALATALAWSVLDLLPKAVRSPLAAQGLMIIVLLVFYTFGENLEILAYLLWPGLLLLGLAFQERSFLEQRQC